MAFQLDTIIQIWVNIFVFLCLGYTFLKVIVPKEKKPYIIILKESIHKKICTDQNAQI